MLHSLDMPSTLTEDSTTYLTKSSATSASKRSSVEKQNRNSGDRAPSPSVRKDNAVRANGVKSNGAASGNGVPVGGGTVSNGQAVEAEAAQKENDDLADLQLANLSRPSTIIESDRSEPERRSQRYSTRDDGYFAEVAKTEERTFSTHVMLEANNGRDTPTNGDGANEETTVWSSNVYTDAERTAAGRSSESSMADGSLRTSTQAHRLSSPPPPQGSSSSTNLSTTAPGRLQHRHTLEVPRVSTSRISRDTTRTVEETLTGTGHYSATPNTPTRRRASISLVRRVTRSAHSDVHLDQVPHTEDAERWAEAIKQKRASKRRRRDDEDEDRVVMGTKVDQDHANWVTAYNMLTGIRFTVSRTNAKLDRDLTDADFEAKHKFSFDVDEYSSKRSRRMLIET
jgi:1-phosphatidylinositol-4-phosphate 5-kinase